GVARLVAAMERHDVRRLVYLSFAGVRASRAQLSWLGRWVIAPVVLHNVVADHEAKEKIIIESGLDWTIVRPPRLSNGPARGYRSGAGIAATGIVPQVTRAHVAAFMLATLTSSSYVHAGPAIVATGDPGRQSRTKERPHSRTAALLRGVRRWIRDRASSCPRD